MELHLDPGLAPAASFLLPVHRFGITLSEFSGLFPGIEAIWIALTWGGGPLGVASAPTNLAMATTFWRRASSPSACTTGPPRSRSSAATAITSFPGFTHREGRVPGRRTLP